MDKWIKRDATISSITEVIEANVGMSVEDLLSCSTKNYHIENLSEAAKLIQDTIMSGKMIAIYGDYDADGVTSTAILYTALKSIKGISNTKISVRLPCRFKDGYGINTNVVESMPDADLLITVDNGIAAVEAIKLAKDKGMQVLIIDHHLAPEDGILPPADVIVNPSALKGSTFNSYCGAGLAYRLAKELNVNVNTLRKLSALAAIGTVADVMPLIEDNRNIVIEGLDAINHGITPNGLRVLLEDLGMYEVTAEDIAFKIGPILNAPGRLYESGAEISCKQLLFSDTDSARENAMKLLTANEERKVAVATGVSEVERMIAEECLFGDNPLIVYTLKDASYCFPEGIVGVIAGKLAETYNVPTIVLTETEDGILKGSGRSVGNTHLKECLDKCSDILIKYGGHAAAVGVSINKNDIDAFRQRMAKLVEPVSDSDNKIEYDLEISEKDIEAVMKELNQYEPYGQGNPKPIFRISDVSLSPKAGMFAKRMGAERQHIKLFGKNYSIVVFDGAEKYENMGEPIFLDVIGQLSENKFGGNSEYQVSEIAMKKREKEGTKSVLADMIFEALKKNKL